MYKPQIETLKYTFQEDKLSWISLYLLLMPFLFFTNYHHGPLKAYLAGCAIITLGLWRSGNLTDVSRIIWVSWLSLVYSFGVVLFSFCSQETISWQEVFRFFYKHIFLGGSIGVGYWVLRSYGVQSFLSSLKIGAVLGGILSIIMHTGQNFPELNGRLYPFGLVQQPIFGASIYAMVGLICFYQIFEKKLIQQVILNLAVFCLSSFIVLLTMSRGPLLAYSLSLILVLGYFIYHCDKLTGRGRYIWGIMAILGIGSVIFVMQLAKHANLLSLWTSRDSYRLQIWKETWSYIKDYFPWGVGFKKELSIVLTDIAQANHPHNLFLSKLYREGLIGLLFLLEILVLCILKINKVWRTHFGGLASLLFIHGILSCLTDTSTFWDGKNFEMILFFWFPILFIAAIKEPNLVDRS